MVSFLFASHIRIATRKLRRLTKGMPDFRSRHSYSGLDASPAYEGSASFSRLTSVSQPGSFGTLRRVCPVFTHNVCISAREVPTSAKGQLPFRVSHPYRDQQAVLRMKRTLRVLKDDGLSSGPTAPRYPSSFTNPEICYASIALIRKTCGFKNETHASRAEDDGLSSGPTASRYPSSFTNPEISYASIALNRKTCGFPHVRTRVL